MRRAFTLSMNWQRLSQTKQGSKRLLQSIVTIVTFPFGFSLWVNLWWDRLITLDNAVLFVFLKPAMEQYTTATTTTGEQIVVQTANGQIQQQVSWGFILCILNVAFCQNWKPLQWQSGIQKSPESQILSVFSLMTETQISCLTCRHKAQLRLCSCKQRRPWWQPQASRCRHSR